MPVALTSPGGGGGASGSAAAYGLPRLKGIAIMSGFSDSNAPLGFRIGSGNTEAEIAAAIAMAESSGVPDAVNYNTNGTIDVGLWQINSSHFSELHQTEASLKNGMTNGAAAYHIYKNDGGFKNWTTYTSGAYKQYLGGTKPTSVTQAAASGIGDLAAPLEDIAKAIGFIFSKQFLYIVAGGILVLVALVLLVRATGASQHIPKVVPV